MRRTRVLPCFDLLLVAFLLSCLLQCHSDVCETLSRLYPFIGLFRFAVPRLRTTGWQGSKPERGCRDCYRQRGVTSTALLDLVTRSTQFHSSSQSLTRFSSHARLSFSLSLRLVSFFRSDRREKKRQRKDRDGLFFFHCSRRCTLNGSWFWLAPTERGETQQLTMEVVPRKRGNSATKGKDKGERKRARKMTEVYTLPASSVKCTERSMKNTIGSWDTRPARHLPPYRVLCVPRLSV